jgi:hypothetical protein
MNKEGKLSFDNAAQRSLVWNNDQKSLLIHSMIIDYPIPAMYCNCVFENTKNKTYDFLDGKQRTLGSIIPFLNDEFALTNVPIINMDEDSENDEDADPEKLIDINGLKFSELPEDFQNIVKNYSITVYYYENMPQDDCEEMIARLNNGRCFTAIELTRLKAKSFETIKEISKHELFTAALTEKAINKYTNEDITIKAWALLNAENPSFDTKYIRPLIESADITETQAEDIKQAFTRILDAYMTISGNDDKESTKIAKRVITRTHLLSLVPVALQSVKQNINIDQFTEFTKSFFSGKKSASINDVYNSAIGAGVGKVENVKKRNDSITDAYNTYFKKETETKEPEKAKEESKSEPKKEVKHSLPQLELYPTSDSDWENSCRIPSNIMSSYTATIAG